jgi:hypothetical protein
MRIAFYIPFLLLLFIVKLSGQELWHVYKMCELDSKDSIKYYYNYSDAYFLINHDTLTLYQKENQCFIKYSSKIDSIRNDSIFSVSFFSIINPWAVTESKSIYHSMGDLIYHNVSTLDIGDTTNMKAYFERVDISLEGQINSKVCVTEVHHNTNITPIPHLNTQLLYNLLGQKMNLHIAKKSQTIHLTEYKKYFNLKE